MSLARLMTPEAKTERRLRLLSFEADDGSVEMQFEAKEPDDVVDLLQRIAKTPGWSDIVLLPNKATDQAQQGRTIARAKVRIVDRTRVDIPSPDRVDFDFGKDVANPFAPLAGTAHDSGHTVAASADFSELTLVAVVHDGAASLAMLEDAGQKGWVARRGDIVGRTDAPNDPNPEACRWRVDQIDASRVTFVRSDPSVCAATPKMRKLDLKH